MTEARDGEARARDPWRGSRIFAARYEKSATALVALARTLRRAPAVAGGVEFVELYDRVVDLPPDAFARVWSKDPGAYLWVHCAFDLAAPELIAPSDTEPDAALVAKETIELAFLAAVQHLPPRPRAVLILRDVLGWSAIETADALDARAR